MLTDAGSIPAASTNSLVKSVGYARFGALDLDTEAHIRSRSPTMDRAPVEGPPITTTYYRIGFDYRARTLFTNGKSTVQRPRACQS